MTAPNKNLENFPFRTVLNLSSLVSYWEANLESNNIFSGYPAKKIKKMIAAAPELREPIEDLDMLNKHKELVGLLMSAVFPPALISSELAAAILPFNFQGFYATPKYRKMLPFDRIREDITVNIPGNNMLAGKIMKACIFILNRYYNTGLNDDQPMLVTIPDEETGLKQVFKVDLNTQFADVICNGELDPIDKKTLRMLLDNLYDVDLWLEHIKPEKFHFEGFSIMKLTDVTTEEMLSSVKYDLLKKDAVTCSSSFKAIQQKIRAIFRLPDMALGLTYFDPNNNMISNYGASDWSSFMMPNSEEAMNCDYFIGSIYDKAYQKQRPVIVEDLEDLENIGHIEQALIKKGIKSVVVAPLIVDDEVIGMLELGSPKAGHFNPVSASKLDSLLPMFTAAVHRVLGEMRMEVRALIQEECTSIHPTVEWKFLERGYDLMNQRRRGAKAELGDIVFNHVYPIYGLSDIRNSSLERSRAIQLDLRNNLRQVKKVISTILEYKNMPILDEINYRVDLEIKKISSGLDSGDESGVLDFLRNEVVPTFNYFKEAEELLRPVIEDYEKLLDPKLGVIYDKRKDFEESLTKINETISAYLDQVEEQAQQIFPHYFEKYKTDGVEYNIYLGDSLVKDRRFSKLLLSNFRLWQLITQCEIAVNIEKLKPQLSRQLDITQLILVHGEPLSIKFRRDEKHFDVDGAYNIRYEIVKKRIDKANIKGTSERLTQPGKIAIVYTQQKEAEEYMRYIEYLKSIDYVLGDVEFLELEELQGANGLKALRIQVNLKSGHREYGNELLKDVIAAINA